MPPPPSKPSGNSGGSSIAQDIALNITYFGVSFIPVIGNTVAVAELLGAMVNNVDLFGNEVDNVDKMIMAMGVLLPHVLKVPGVKNTLKSMIGYLKKGGVPAKNALLKIFKKGAGSTVKLFADAGKGSFHGINIFDDLGGEFLENAGEIVDDVVSGDWNNLFKTKKMKPADIVDISNGGSTKLADKLKKDLKIPDGWEISLAQDKEGIRISKPGTLKGDTVRVMPGGSGEYTKEPYVVLTKGGHTRDINGTKIDKPGKNTHFDLRDFEMPDWMTDDGVKKL